MSEAVSNQEQPELHPDFVSNLVKTVNDSQRHGVHLLFNEWWATAPQSTIETYLQTLKATPGADLFLEERFMADELSMEQLGAYPEGSVGRGYHDFLAANGLETNLAANYGQLHQFMLKSGQLDRMPEELKYAISRGFQVHDILHVLTGYTPNGLHELELQAFSLAQLQFPYFGMWMATVTSQMTFLKPESIVPVMDALSSGWQFGRAVKNLSFERWEEKFDLPLAEVREAYGIDPNGLMPLL